MSTGVRQHKGNKDVAELLLANKAEVNARDNNGWTPLHRAAFGGHKDVVELLLVNHADVNAKEKSGGTPLQCAAGTGHKDVAELLRLSAVGQKGPGRVESGPFWMIQDFPP